jgi:hypothetical protein
MEEKTLEKKLKEQKEKEKREYAKWLKKLNGFYRCKFNPNDKYSYRTYKGILEKD